MIFALTPDENYWYWTKFLSPENSPQRWEIINHFARLYNYQTYLEIGVNRALNIRNVIIPNKDGVEPSFKSYGDETDLTNIPEINYRMTSDDFFKYAIENQKKYDCVFIDGLHEYEQVEKDIINSFLCLNENGTIIMHDCLPLNEELQRVPRETGIWNGDTWKAYVKLRCSKPNLDMCVMDTDWGVGVIRKGTQNIYNKTDINTCLTYEYFAKNTREMLNLISMKKFFKKYK